MIPFFVLLFVTLSLRALGAAGAAIFQNWTICLRGGLAAMFLVTASGHWGRRRSDLVRMVPPIFPRPDLLVTITGLLEIVGAIGLLFSPTAKVAAICLAAMLIAVFPANIYAAKRRLTLGGQAATALPLRTALQIIFIAALALASREP